MQGALKSLLYRSRRAQPLDDAQVYEIYRQATDNNALEGITGVLIHDGDYFVQLLEAGEDAMAGMMNKLRADPRHCNLEVIDERTIERRSFGGWSMKLVKVDHAPFVAVDDVETEIADHVDPEIRALIIETVAASSRGDGHFPRAAMIG